jgi:hypothetical protein
MIHGKIEDFIGIYENALDTNTCNNIIQYFESLRQYNLVIGHEHYTTKAHTRKDESVFWCHPDVITLPQGSPMLTKFSEAFWKCYEDYCKEYELLKSAASHGFYMVRIQRTDPGGGFHNWHFENTGNETANRLVTFSLYLNDVDEGGETEFLYLHKRIKPKTGTMLIWPSTYTHAHRGNPPLTNTKYIITGWLTYFG